MRKTPSLFMRNYDGDHLVRDEVVPGSEWVAAGEGVATLKYDGTCCLVRSGKLYKRYDAKRGKTPPPNFEPAQEPDPITGHWTGWLPVGDEPSSKWHMEAWTAQGHLLADGTYELCGPKLQANPHDFAAHVFIRHGDVVLDDCPRAFDALKAYLADRNIEGVVWHHPDGRMVKIKTRDFGLTWPRSKE